MEKYKDKANLIRETLAKIDRMNGYEFENYLSVVFYNLGYEVIGTPVSGDFGADLILNKDNERVIIQAKRYNGKVGTEAVTQVLTGMAYYKGTSGKVITNSFFTKQSIELATKTNVELVDRFKLEILIFESELKSEGREVSEKELQKIYRKNIRHKTINSKSNMIRGKQPDPGKELLKLFKSTRQSYRKTKRKINKTKRTFNKMKKFMK